MREAVSVWRGLNVEEERNWRWGEVVVVGVKVIDRGCLEIGGDDFESARERRGTTVVAFMALFSGREDGGVVGCN